MTWVWAIAFAVGDLVVLWLLMAALGRLVEGEWFWSWPVEMLRDIFGRRS